MNRKDQKQIASIGQFIFLFWILLVHIVYFGGLLPYVSRAADLFLGLLQAH